MIQITYQIAPPMAGVSAGYHYVAKDNAGHTAVAWTRRDVIRKINRMLEASAKGGK